VVTGASDDDPSGIATYAAAGAAFGYATLWTALLTFPLMASVQFICAKIGMVYGRGLAGVMRRHYPRPLVYAVVLSLMIVNTLNAAADLAAIVAGVNLLVPLRTTILILPVGLMIAAVQIWGSYRLIEKIFKWLTLTLFAYIGAAVMAHPDWRAVLHNTWRPTFAFDKSFLTILVAILGTTISPYLFFWQANHEVEEEVARGRTSVRQRKGASASELKFAAADVNIGMLFSNTVMFFIILATAATLHRAGHTVIATASEAAEALRPLAGQGAYVLMALALIGSGFLAVPILTGSGAYAVAEVFGWKCGLDEKPGRAKEFYIVIAASMLAALCIDYLGISVMKALVWTAVINACLAPPLLVIVMFIANNRAVMGEQVNGTALNVMGWTTTALMFAATIALLVM